MNAVIIISAKYLFLVSLGAFAAYLVYLWLKSKPEFLSVVRLSLLSLPLSYLAGKIASHLFYNPRPFVSEHLVPLIPHVPDNGFPSDHALLTMTVAAIVFAADKKLGMALFAIATLVGTARILAHLHHPLDIIGSSAIAIASTGVSYLILPQLTKLARRSH